MSSQALKAAATGKQQGEIVNRNQHPILAKTDYLEKRKELLGSGIPGHMVIEREIRTATVMLMNSKDLQDAKVDSFYTAVSIAVNSGIGLGNGKGYLVAYKGNVSYIPGWKGLVDLVSRTGRASVWTGVVHAQDEFDYALGDSPFLKHKPGDNEDHADITHYYAVGRVKGSEWPVIEVWSAYKVKKHLDKYNKVGPRHYAHKDENNFEMYARKVVLLQALKYLPQSQDLENAINAEIASETGKGATIDGNFVFVTDDDGFPDMPADVTDVQNNNEPPSEFETLKARMQSAKNMDALNEAADLMATVEDPDLRIDLANIYEQQKMKLSK